MFINVRIALACRRKSVVKKIRFNYNSLGEDAPIGLLKSELVADLFFASSVSCKSWTGIIGQTKLSGQHHTFLLSQVNFSLGNIPRLSPKRVRHENNENKKLAKYLLLQRKKLFHLVSRIFFSGNDINVTSTYVWYNKKIILAKQNTVTLVVSCCYEMKDSILLLQLSSLNIETSKFNMLFTKVILQMGSKDFMSAGWMISGVIITVILCDKCWIDLIILAHSLILKENLFCLYGAKGSFIPPRYRKGKKQVAEQCFTFTGVHSVSSTEN